MSHANKTPKVISRRVVRKADKVGRERTTHSVDAHEDAAQSTRIEETNNTRTYVKTTRPPTVSSGPSRTPESDAHVQERPITHTPHCDSLSIITWLMAVIGVAAVTSLLLSGSNLEPLAGKLTDARWTFSGFVSERRMVTLEGWDLPHDAAALASETRQRSTKQVLDHEETLCETHWGPIEILDGYRQECGQGITGWSPPQKIYSHSEERCEEEIVAWTDETEVYSHTEELCYDDGHCEEKDVYDLVPPEPIRDQVCESHDVYIETNTEPIYGVVCEDVPVYRSEIESREECKVVRVMRDEPVMGTWWTYTVPRWIYTRTIQLVAEEPGMERADVKALLREDQRYDSEGWDHYIYLNGTRKVSVTWAQYDDYRMRLGEDIIFGH